MWHSFFSTPPHETPRERWLGYGAALVAVAVVTFRWTERTRLKNLARSILFGGEDIAPFTHEVLRKAERDPACRPAVHVG